MSFTVQPAASGSDLIYGLYVADPGGPYLLTTTFGPAAAALSPDGVRIAITRENQGPCFASVYRFAGAPIPVTQWECRPSTYPSAPVGFNSLTRGALSLDAHYLVFESSATNWLTPPTSGTMHVYLYDHSMDSAPQLIDRTPNGEPGTCSGPAMCGFSAGAMISDDGSVVAFASADSDLVTDDTNNGVNVFVWRRSDRSISLQSLGSDGQEASLDCMLNAMSEDGRFLVFSTSSPNLAVGDSNGRSDVFLRDTLEGTTRLISVGLDGYPAGALGHASVSRDGRYVSFISDAGNLVAGVASGEPRLYVRDVAAGETYLIPAPDGYIARDALISGDGHTIAYVVDRTTASGPPAKVMAARSVPAP